MPDKEQELLLAKHFGCAGVVYNHFLNERIEQYKKNNQVIAIEDLNVKGMIKNRKLSKHIADAS